MANLLTSVVDWLRKGYPEGVPAKDFPPLLALLQRSLTPDEVQEACAQIIAANPDGAIVQADVATAIEQIKDAPPSDDQINLVAARLAAVGWPLSVPDEFVAAAAEDGPADDTTGSPGSLLQRILGWLRAGYPEGVPPTDYVPILALLQRRLTDDEVKQVARTLIAHGDVSADGSQAISEADAQDVIGRVTQSEPSEADLNRVRERLAAKGWPLQA